MSIRARLVVMCLVVALLPALPLSLLVKALLEKSFDVGLNATVEDALQSGLVISRHYLEELRRGFEEDVAKVVAASDLPGRSPDFARALEERVSASARITGVLVPEPVDEKALPAHAGAAAILERYAREGRLDGVLDEGERIVERETRQVLPGVRFADVEDRSHQFALWNGVVFYSETDPAFLAGADRVLTGRQIFAQLRLTQPSLSRSFFYPFIIIYSVILALSLVLALVISERLSNPIRRLVRGTNLVATGDWSHRLDFKAGGEVGRLVDAFNTMVDRLDAQRRRLVDMEKMATWREMARHLAHEIKNPLLPIGLTVREMTDQYKGDDERYKEILAESSRVVGDELDRLKALVKEFSSFARMPELKPRRASLDALARDVATLYPQVPTEIVCDPRPPDFRFDPDQMRGVLVNLFDNAVSVAGEASNLEVRIRIRRSGDEVVLGFSDNGPGIPAGEQAKIFEPYFTTRAEGTGLGLAMVKSIVLLHGGTIHAEDSPEGGAAFIVSLPLEGPEGPAAPAKES